MSRIQILAADRAALRELDVSPGFLLDLEGACLRYRRRQRDPTRWAEPPSPVKEMRKRLMVASKGFALLGEAFEKAPPGLAQAFEEDWQRRNRGDSTDFVTWLRELRLLQTRSASLLQRWMSPRKRGPKVDALREVLYLDIAVAFHGAGRNVRLTVGSPEAQILARVVSAATGQRLPEEGEGLLKILRFIRESVRAR